MPVHHSHGFTLLELLIAMSIIGIVTAIAVPQFRQYKARAFDTRAMSDLRNVAMAEESYFIDYESYRSCSNIGCTTLPGIAALSKGVALAISSTPSGFTGTASHTQGSGRNFAWNTARGGLQ